MSLLEAIRSPHQRQDPESTCANPASGTGWRWPETILKRHLKEKAPRSPQPSRSFLYVESASRFIGIASPILLRRSHWRPSFPTDKLIVRCSRAETSQQCCPIARTRINDHDASRLDTGPAAWASSLAPASVLRRSARASFWRRRCHGPRWPSHGSDFHLTGTSTPRGSATCAPGSEPEERTFPGLRTSARPHVRG